MNNVGLRPFNTLDTDYIFDNWVRTNVMEGQTALHKVSSRSELEKLICTWNSKNDKGKFCEILLIVDGEIKIGLISLYGLDSMNISIGCTIDRNFWNMGYGTKAVSLAIKKAKEYKYNYVKTQCLSTNYASIKLHEKCEFTFVECKINREGNLCNFYEIKL